MRKIFLSLVIVFAILVTGCSRLTIERGYDSNGIVSERIQTYGLFVNRANQLALRKTDQLSSDIIESAIKEDASPGNQALKDFIEVYKLGLAAAAK